MKFKWALKKIGTEIYNHRADIEYAAGTIMVMAGTGMAIAKAPEATEVKKQVDEKIALIDFKDSDDSWEDGERGKACFDMVKTAAVGYGKCYGPAIGVEATGIVLQTISHKSLKNQVGSLAASLTANAAAFAQYRQRVIDDMGAEKDEEYLMGKVKEVVMNEDGTEVETTLPATIPQHSFLFDESNPNWEKGVGANLDFLENHLLWLNQRLWTEGVLFENDIRRDIGADIDPDALDWGITAVDDEGNRQYISFGIERDTERAKAFRSGAERSFLITLNVEPCIGKKLYRLNKYHN